MPLRVLVQSMKRWRSEVNMTGHMQQQEVEQEAGQNAKEEIHFSSGRYLPFLEFSLLPSILLLLSPHMNSSCVEAHRPFSALL